MIESLPISRDEVRDLQLTCHKCGKENANEETHYLYCQNCYPKINKALSDSILKVKGIS